MRYLSLLLVLLAALPATATPASAKDLRRITAQDARFAARYAFSNVADALGKRLIITPCTPVGRLSRACTVRIGDDRYRAISHYIDTNRGLIMSALRLPSRNSSASGSAA